MTSAQTSRLTDLEEVLLRQVHPTLRPAGKVSKEAFIPNENDRGRVSTLRGAVGAAEAYRRWIEEEKRESVGTYGVSIAEVDGLGDVVAIDDAAAMGKPDHASIDMTAVPTAGQLKKKARLLRDHAESLGCLHAP